jgi:hypothetical protein
VRARGENRADHFSFLKGGRGYKGELSEFRRIGTATDGNEDVLNALVIGAHANPLQQTCNSVKCISLKKPDSPLVYGHYSFVSKLSYLKFYVCQRWAADTVG